MSDERPLHIRTAEALGWRDIRPEPLPISGFYKHEDGVICHDGLPPWNPVEKHRQRVPRFDAEQGHEDYYDYFHGWAATGPLIEQYRLSLQPTWKAISPPRPGDYIAGYEVQDSELRRRIWETAETPLRAVCLLLIRMRALGLLA